VRSAEAVGDQWEIQNAKEIDLKVADFITRNGELDIEDYIEFTILLDRFTRA